MSNVKPDPTPPPIQGRMLASSSQGVVESEPASLKDMFKEAVASSAAPPTKAPPPLPLPPRPDLSGRADVMSQRTMATAPRPVLSTPAGGSTSSFAATGADLSGRADVVPQHTTSVHRSVLATPASSAPSVFSSGGAVKSMESLQAPTLVSSLSHQPTTIKPTTVAGSTATTTTASVVEPPARPLSTTVPLFHAAPPTTSSSPWALSGLAGGPVRVFGGGKGGNSGRSPNVAAAAPGSGNKPTPPTVPPRPIGSPARPQAASSNEIQYEISDKESSGSSSDEDEENDKPRKNVPNWAKGTELRDALERQYVAGPSRLDPDEIFPEIPSCDPLEEIFKDAMNRNKNKNAGFRPRGSSAIWVKDGLTKGEKLAYRKAMGWDR